MTDEFDAVCDVCIASRLVSGGVAMDMAEAKGKGQKIWEERGKNVYRVVVGDGE